MDYEALSESKDGHALRVDEGCPFGLSVGTMSPRDNGDGERRKAKLEAIALLNRL